ncbi:TRAP transporter substrate-binding protein [Alteribacter natronophilus]|uniref:TRAP transporter substrate-binding protein n=1 Tax=Alteribacter natronophilus TaxID=2583810 RepID=UPI00110D54ED|nr:TRAP transporter substrate-binding protein [Alteribacter natronophilus]TMW72259.1 DctP family TRAP transporter solute-binding subunit [Alteribacter natronophilus]
MKKWLLTGAAALLTAGLAACGDEDTGGDGEAGGNADETFTLSIGHTLAETSHYQEALYEFKDMIEERSDGRIEIEIFADGALGGEREMIESLQMGDQEMVLTSTGPMSGFAEEVTVVDLPFLFRDHDHAHGVLDGEIGQDLLDELDPHGLVGLAWWENGFRHLTNNDGPVHGPEDVDGLSLRTMENDIHMAAFREMGGDPTPMSFTELFTALQQGVIDGQENPIPVIYSSRFYEVQDHLSLTGHVYNPSILIVSEQVYESMPEDLQQILRETAEEGAIIEREIVQRMEDDFITELEEEGMEVVHDVDLEAFIDAVQPVYDEYADVFGQDLIDAIMDHE